MEAFCQLSWRVDPERRPGRIDQIAVEPSKHVLPEDAVEGRQRVVCFLRKDDHPRHHDTSRSQEDGRRPDEPKLAELTDAGRPDFPGRHKIEAVGQPRGDGAERGASIDEEAVRPASVDPEKHADAAMFVTAERKALGPFRQPDQRTASGNQQHQRRHRFPRAERGAARESMS
jgi:hypothetical protein